ncbi:GNAT family N-acetyltransferase [Piscibacillus salipiscarius]|uniref:GNAT family N-acetyltransferase n=1 Tax=Piscibacillus salipiscarius TaxID=299480 RepID=UPI0006D20B4F|nr:GNAT family N-acetyltransferase [Piscibacillus salipiscarius]
MVDPTKWEISTKRLIIRPYCKADYEQWWQGFNGRKPSQYKFDEGRPRDMSRFTRKWFSKWISGFEEKAKNDEMYILGVFRKLDGAAIGKVELVTILRHDYQWGMIGYSINNQYWSRGYGTECVKAFTEAVLNDLEFHRIELHINPENTPSVRLAHRVGYQLECKRKEFTKENGAWQDMLVFYQNSH